MGMVRKTISLSEENDAWVKSKVASGKFASDSEVLRTVVQHYMEAERHKEAILTKIQAGRDSGYSEASFNEIVARGRKKAKSVLASRQKGAA
ncbi:type II toxin-antitoxin system ParD family antitoxin [Litorimonas sp.]|jgi:antitoxin ParD1/3/4|uniref:type II toxin-antitoxin system ParD family antitoxin n=1 Tax=Litorimonas sp. TaxID=1892381 RepID=UPI003A8BEC3B